MRKPRNPEQPSYISFKRLIGLLFDKGMSTSDLCKLTGISASTMTEIRANRSVTLDTIVKICRALKCPIEAIVEINLEEVE